MTSLCVYTMPIAGDVILKQPLKFVIDDLVLQFFTQEDVLTTLLIICPLPDSEEKEMTDIGGMSVYEPRGNEIEEIVLQIGSGFSLFTSSNVEILYEDRIMKWFEGTEIKDLKVGIYDRLYRKKSGPELALPLFIRCILTGCIIKKHDPSLTFYNRGASDASASRFIEAFYNLFFFLEHLFGNGKSGEKTTVDEFMKSELLTSVIDKVKNDSGLVALVSPKFLEMIKSKTIKENIRLIVKTRGNLHHPNKNRPNYWDPRKQRYFENETLFLQFICMEIAHRLFLHNSFTPKVERAYKKVQRCLRKEEEIVVVTR